jgi:hypothetical protein
MKARFDRDVIPRGKNFPGDGDLRQDKIAPEPVQEECLEITW